MTPPRASQAFPRQRLGSERDSVTFSEDLNLALLGDNTDDKVAMTVPATGAKSRSSMVGYSISRGVLKDVHLPVS